MLGPFTFTLESEEFEKVACAAADLYQTMINTRAPDGASKVFQYKYLFALFLLKSFVMYTIHCRFFGGQLKKALAAVESHKKPPNLCLWPPLSYGKLL